MGWGGSLGLTGHDGGLGSGGGGLEWAGGREGREAELRPILRPEASVPRMVLLGGALEEEERGEELGEGWGVLL